ncbi:MAG: class I SAM-dependent methyltransferase [Alphaproteobacteria bacterium]|nr:class I SAM-dependent methyltransferase [Alphaproteobacteria bacterium]
MRPDDRQAEFDCLADTYHEQHKANVAITGEEPAYFAAYKIADLAALLAHASPAAILDFGSGIGNSLPYFRKHFPHAALTCADVSARSITLAKERFPGPERYVQIGKGVPLPDASQDVVFSACVFHHIPHEEHAHWLAELRRVTRPGGLLAIFEHNPLNPLTVRAVNTCPLDVNARLIRGATMRSRAEAAGWQSARIDYRLFFPAALAGLRFLEPGLGWLCLGAQYRLTVRRPA